MSMEYKTNQEWSDISKQLLKDPANFKIWQNLVAAAESNNGRGITKATDAGAIEILRASYQSFLRKYPLLHKYVISYALWEFKLGNTNGALQIFKQGLRLLSHSLDLWISYLEFKIETSPNDLDSTIQEFEEARRHVGYHFHSFEFYSMYLDFLSTYQDESNDFKMRYYILLRQLVELPTYHYAHYFGILFESIGWIANNTRPDLVCCLVNKTEHKAMNKTSPKQIASHLKKVFTDAFITIQYRVYELFQFEKLLSRGYYHVTFVCQEQLQAWENYFNFLELCKFPAAHIELVYERCLIVTSDYPTFWLKYANYHVKQNNICRVIETLTRGFEQSGHYQLIVRLADTHLYLCQYIAARDLITGFIANNVQVPLPIYEKLVNIERLMNPNDDQYLVLLLTNLVTETKHAWWFHHILLYSIPFHVKQSFFANHQQAFADCTIFQDATKKLNLLKHGTVQDYSNSMPVPDFATEYDEEMSKFLKV